MPFKDTKEGFTHHKEDYCYKCKECEGHYLTISELHQHLSESVQCSDLVILEVNKNNPSNS